MFNRIRGNARASLFVEPLFILPYTLFLTYASVYMLALGVNERQIGLLTSLGLVLQIVSSFISGYLTDRMGRRAALLTFDLVSWTVATLIWAFAQNFWFFFFAAIFNSFQRIPNTAWNCLLVEDTPPKNRSAIYAVVQLISVVAGLFAPLGGWLVSGYGLIPAVRFMYVLAAVSMTLMMIIRHFTTHETEIGIRRKKASQQGRFREDFKEYADVMKDIMSNNRLLVLFAVYILMNFQMTIRNTYFSIYLVDRLHFSDAVIAWFPAISSVVILLLMYLLMPRLKEERMFIYMIAGFAISAVSILVLLFAPEQNLTWILISTMLAAAGTIISNPYMEASVANSIDDENRAKSFSLLQVLILCFISPAGIIGGWTYTINPAIPFVVIIAAFLLSIALLSGLIARSAETA